jgi:uncharacterized membrane protein YfhO
VQRNPQALGNAWFVQRLILVKTPDEELAALKNLQPATEAVVDITKFPVQQTEFNPTGSTIRLVSYEPNHLQYEATAAQDGMAVFSEIYYKDGWNAYLDGKPVDHLRVNYILRALRIPSGKHTIAFKFEPQEYVLGNTVSMISSILMILMVVGGVFFAWRTPPGKE